MTPARVAGALFFLIGAYFASAQSLYVAYVGGDVRARIGPSLVDISPGDRLSAETTLQLGDGAYVELNAAQTKIELSQKGVYKLQDILSYSRSLRSAGVGKALLMKLSLFLARTGENQSAIAGVRGADTGKTETSEWMTSDAQVFLDTGKEYIISGQFDQAIGQLLQALETATDREAPRARCYLAYAYSLKGDFRDALKYSADLHPSRSDEWAPDFVILRAKLLIDGSAFAQEIAWLTNDGNDLSGDAQRAAIYFFLLGLGYRGIDDSANEKRYLSKVVSITGDSDLGKAAAWLERSR
jgi:tetratricopeptide (TPR) repeat protein